MGQSAEWGSEVKGWTRGVLSASGWMGGARGGPPKLNNDYDVI